MPTKTKAKAKTDVWQNRIVGQGTEEPTQLLANPNNWRTHPGMQRDAIRGSLADIGWVQQIVVNRTTGHVVDGHLRVEEAISADVQEVPVLYVELTEAEERLVLATLDPLSAMAAQDDERLTALLQSFDLPGNGLDLLLEQLAGNAPTLPDQDDAWQGMPSFESEDRRGFKRLVVHFATREDFEAFTELVGQPLTERTISIWYPEEPKLVERDNARFGSDD